MLRPLGVWALVALWIFSLVKKENALHIEHMEAFSDEDRAEKDQARKPKDQAGEALEVCLKRAFSNKLAHSRF